jgi:hypothetical protein
MYHCCFRLADILRLQCEGIATDATVIRLQAHKTHRNHAFPVPQWLSQYLGPVRLPFACGNDHAATIMRAELDRVSALAKVHRVYPRNIRQAGITAWSQANGMAGAIAHGSGLSGSVLQHYVSSLQVLTAAAPRVRVPACMRGDCNTDDIESTLITHFRRMDAAAQTIITSTAERLSAG